MQVRLLSYHCHHYHCPMMTTTTASITNRSLPLLSLSSCMPPQGWVTCYSSPSWNWCGSHAARHTSTLSRSPAVQSTTAPKVNKNHEGPLPKLSSSYHHTTTNPSLLMRPSGRNYFLLSLSSVLTRKGHFSTLLFPSLFSSLPLWKAPKKSTTPRRENNGLPFLQEENKLVLLLLVL